MKSILFLFLLFTCFGTAQNRTVAVSHGEGHEGRCTGSAYCTACRNCSRCAHCGSGGSCGVCSSTTETYDYTPKKKKSKTSKPYAVKTSYSHYKGETLYIISTEVNLRKGPATSYDIIEKLEKYQEVTFLKQVGDWFFVQSEDSGNKGYIHSKYIQ